LPTLQRRQQLAERSIGPAGLPRFMPNHHVIQVMTAASTAAVGDDALSRKKRPDAPSCGADQTVAIAQGKSCSCASFDRSCRVSASRLCRRAQRRAPARVNARRPIAAPNATKYGIQTGLRSD
jgi:hypothetical protein